MTYPLQWAIHLYRKPWLPSSRKHPSQRGVPLTPIELYRQALLLHVNTGAKPELRVGTADCACHDASSPPSSRIHLRGPFRGCVMLKSDRHLRWDAGINSPSPQSVPFWHMSSGPHANAVAVSASIAMHQVRTQKASIAISALLPAASCIARTGTKVVDTSGSDCESDTGHQQAVTAVYCGPTIHRVIDSHV